MKTPIRSLIALTLCLAVAPPVAAQETWREPASGMSFVRIPKGCFQMGVPAGAFSDEDPALQARIRGTEQPAHEVCLDEFWIGRTEVTEKEWRAIMGEGGPSTAGAAPAGAVTWQEAQDFARRFARKASGGDSYRLPTEAEWEYACRAGEPPAARMPGRDDLKNRAWFSSHYDFPFSGTRHTAMQPVGTRAANRLGVHDMLGNAWEWTQDNYAADAYARHQLFNPVIVTQSDLHVIRGGSIRSDSRMLRCEARAWLKGGTRQDTTGFRLVRVPSGASR